LGGGAICRGGEAGVPVVPAKHEDVIKIVRKIGKPGKRIDVKAELFSAGMLQRSREALAYAVLDRDLRGMALELIRGHLRGDRQMLPYVIEAAKWGRGRERMIAVSIFGECRDRRAIPVIMEYVLDDRYAALSSWGPPGGGVHFSTTTLFSRTSKVLYALSDGGIGYEVRPKGVRNEQLRATWREWWKKNAKTVLPEWKGDVQRFDSKEAILAWCKQRRAQWPEWMSAEADKSLKDYLKKVAGYAWVRRDSDIGGHMVPKELAAPIGTAALFEAMIAGDEATAAGEREQQRIRKRVSLLCLVRSRDRGPAVALLEWALTEKEDVDYRAYAYVLGRLGGPKAAELLGSLLDKKVNDKTVVEIGLSLGETKNSAAASPLGKLLQRESPVGIRIVVERALIKVGKKGRSQAKAIAEALGPNLAAGGEETIVALKVLSEVGREDAVAVMKAAMPNLTADAKKVAHRAIEECQRRIAASTRR